MIGDVLVSMDDVATKVAALAGTIALILIYCLKMLSLYERHWSRRRHRRLKELRAGEDTDSPLAHYLDDALYLEGYRIATGIRASRAKVDFLLRVASTHFWTPWQVRQIARFIFVSPEMPTPQIRITRLEVLGAYCALWIGMGILVIGIVLGVAVALKGDNFGAFAVGVALIFAYAIVGGVVKSGFDSYSVAKKFGEYWAAHPQSFCLETIDEDGVPKSGQPLALHHSKVVRA